MRDPPKRCLFCHSDRLVVTEASETFILACRACGGTVAYTPNPPDDPTLAGRIELLIEPYKK